MLNEPTNVCLFGAGGHGRVVAAIAHKIWPRAELCFGDQQRPLGTPVGALSIRFSKLEDIVDHAIITTIGNTVARKACMQHAARLGLPFATLIANPDTYYAKPPGAGSMALSAVVVNPGAQIGAGVILNSGAIVEHDCVIGDYCHLAPGAVVLGDCTLGNEVWLGANATILQGLSITDNVTIGAGSVVTANITETGTYVGQPARKISHISTLSPHSKAD